MERIKEGRRDVLVHSDVTVDDLPVANLTELPEIAEVESFVPNGMDRPTLYTGDVVVGAHNGDINFAELLYEKVGDGVVVYELDTGLYKQMTGTDFSKRFYGNQVHLFSDVVEDLVESDVTLNAEKLPTPPSGRT